MLRSLSENNDVKLCKAIITQPLSNPLSQPSNFRKTSNLLCHELVLSNLLCHEPMLSNLTTQLSIYSFFDMFPWTDFFAVFLHRKISVKTINARISGPFRLSLHLLVTSMLPSQHGRSLANYCHRPRT
jgi:hypothetical protein